MEKYTIKTTKYGNYDYEVIITKGKDYVAAISKSDGNRYLKVSEVPKPIIAYLRKANYRIELLNVDLLNEHLGLCK